MSPTDQCPRRVRVGLSGPCLIPKRSIGPHEWKCILCGGYTANRKGVRSISIGPEWSGALIRQIEHREAKAAREQPIAMLGELVDRYGEHYGDPVDFSEFLDWVVLHTGQVPHPGRLSAYYEAAASRAAVATLDPPVVLLAPPRPGLVERPRAAKKKR